MDNLINYININGEKTYKELPFNEIDALIYSILPYLDFEGLITHPTPINKVIFLLEEKFALKTKDKFTIQNRKLFEYMAKSKRYGNNFIVDYQKVINSSTQFGAIAIEVPHEFKYIAFEGTNDLLIGWEENFHISYEYPISSGKHAINFLKKNIKFHDILVYVGGHSKGGYLATTASINQKFLPRLKIKYIFNFDGPGFLKETINSKAYQKSQKKLRTYYPEESFVGMILYTKGKKKVIKSSKSKIKSHNPHTWEIANNSFIPRDLSSYSKGIHHKINRIIDEYSKEQRSKFTDSFFNLLKTSGYTYRTELSKLSINHLKNIIIKSISLNNEDKKIIFNILKTFLKDESSPKTNE